MNFIKSFDSTNVLMFFIGVMYFFNTFTEDVANFGVFFWVTFGVVLKGIGALMMILGTIFLEINNRKDIEKKIKHEKKKFYFWIVFSGIILAFIGLLLKLKGV